MSNTFSRRLFLKGTAVTAVAAASSSLLSGCSSNSKTPTCSGTGELEVLSVTANLSEATYSSNELSLTMKITNGRSEVLRVNPTCFSAVVTTANSSATCSYYYDTLSIDPDLLTNHLANGESVDGDVSLDISSLNISSKAEITSVAFEYQPDQTYAPSYYMIWNLSSSNITDSTSTG